MSKLLVAILVCLALASCSGSATKTHEDWQREHDKRCASRITKFNYEGHSYLLYQYGVGNKEGVAGICHDANCECQKGGQYGF